MFRREIEHSEGAFFGAFFVVFLGVFFGALAALLTYESIVEWRMERAAKQAAEQVQRQIQKSNAEVVRLNQQRQEAQAKASEAEAARRSALDLAARLERERKERKEQAFSKVFTPSPSCKVDSATPSCANEYMAARKVFEARFGREKLRSGDELTSVAMGLALRARDP